MPSWIRYLLMFTLLTVSEATAPLSRNQEEINRPSAAMATAPSHAGVGSAISAAASYLERFCDSDGKFAYQVNFRTDQKFSTYNIVRHSGAMYALAMRNGLQSDSRSAEAVLRATVFLRRYVGPGVRPGQLVVWSAPLPEHSDAQLGATGLGLVALAAAYKIDPKSVTLDQLQALGRFLLFLQRDDGSFVSKYNIEKGPEAEWESLYYPGEAALGLIALYETDHSIQWLYAAAHSLAYLAKSRAGLSVVPADHWALIATAKLLPYCEQAGCPASRRELLRHAIQICGSILHKQITDPANPQLVGAFDPVGRITPAATRLEGLLAALEFLPQDSSKLRSLIEAAINRGIAFLLRAQITTGPYAGGMPGAIVQGAKGESTIRIDYVQHTLCAWLRYQKLFQQEIRN
jgi:hypothetical protein